MSSAEDEYDKLSPAEKAAHDEADRAKEKADQAGIFAFVVTCMSLVSLK